MRPEKRERYYRAMDGTMYRCLGIGFHMETGEQLAVMRELDTGKTWIISATDLHRTQIIDGEVVRTYTEDFEYQSEYKAPTRPRDPGYEEPYPGTLDQAYRHPNRRAPREYRR